MNWFRRKPDPISDRARALNSEIAALEAQIRRYESQLQETTSESARGATPLPHPRTPSPFASPARPVPARELDLEAVDPRRLTREEDVMEVPVNELGVRKYDLPGLWRKLKGHFRPTSTANPRLVNYLAAGGIQGLRPLRYERRIARNRFLLLFGIFFLVLLGILSVFFRQQ